MLGNVKEILPLLAVLTGGAALLYEQQGVVLGQAGEVLSGEELPTSYQKEQEVILENCYSRG